MRKVALALAVTLSFSAYASSMKTTMQEMKLAFKKSAEAESVEVMQQSVIQLDELVEKLQQGAYPPEKQDVYFEGFEKLSSALDKVNIQLEDNNLQGAKEALRQVDMLREEYHDKRNSGSIWSKLFG
ncbi:cytochrome b562 [Vibrio maerlii]|uniref:cytochrome b562 n=1 Tax=Vibrio maerlii TaxID=2231648 RepID=UPI000E3C7421|nr:cytochrome b562 [Vibrio maerlii]